VVTTADPTRRSAVPVELPIPAVSLLRMIAEHRNAGSIRDLAAALRDLAGALDRIAEPTSTPCQGPGAAYALFAAPRRAW